MIRSTRECLKHRPCLRDQILDGSRRMQGCWRPWPRFEEAGKERKGWYWQMIRSNNVLNLSKGRGGDLMLEGRLYEHH